MVDNLIAKTYAWEDEHDMGFLYDGVTFHFRAALLFRNLIFYIWSNFDGRLVNFLKVRLVSILEEYKHARLQKYEEEQLLRVLK